MTVTNLNVFQSGTLASVTPVNENFETLRVAVNTVEQTVSSNRTYLDNKITEINTSIVNTAKATKAIGEVFCVNKGSFDEYFNESLINISGTTLSLNTPFTATNINGDILNATLISPISISGYTDGTYNVFVSLEGEIEVLKNTIYRQKEEPEEVLNDIWLNTSCIPLTAKIYTANGWADFLKIPVGYFVISDGQVTDIKTNKYNQNGYILNSESDFLMPDYTKGVNKTNGETYVAETSGWLYLHLRTAYSNTTATITIDGTTIIVSSAIFSSTTCGTGNGMFVPVSKGSTYKGAALSYFIFYPIKTV